MNDCLVTKLKGASNSELPKFGEFRFNSGNAAYVNVKGDSALEAVLPGGGFYSGQNLDVETSSPVDVKLSPKYDITEFHFSFDDPDSGDALLYTEDLKYCSKLKALTAGPIFGTFEDLSSLTNLKEFISISPEGSPHLEGNLKVLIENNPNLKKLYFKISDNNYQCDLTAFPQHRNLSDITISGNTEIEIEYNNIIDGCPNIKYLDLSGASLGGRSIYLNTHNKPNSLQFIHFNSDCTVNTTDAYAFESQVGLVGGGMYPDITNILGSEIHASIKLPSNSPYKIIKPTSTSSLNNTAINFAQQLVAEGWTIIANGATYQPTE